MNSLLKILGNWIMPILSIISAGLCIWAMCNYYPRLDLKVDYMGIIVGVLSILVTLLIGWQIFSTIDFNDRLSEINELKKDVENLQKQLSESNQFNSSIKFVSEASIYKLDYNIHKGSDYGVAIKSRLHSILNYTQATKYKTLPHIKDAILDICELLPKINKNTKEIDDIRKVLSLLDDRCKKQTYVTIIQNLDAAINKRFDSTRITKEERQNIDRIKIDTNNLTN